MLHALSSLLPYLRRYRTAYLVGCLCIAGSTALKLLIPYLLGDSIDTLRELAGRSGGGPGGAEVARLIARSAVTITLTAVAVAVIRTLSRLFMLRASRRVVHDVRNSVFDHLLRLAPSFFVRNPTGQIMSRCVNDVQSVQGLTGPVILHTAETALLFVIGLTMMFRIQPTLTLLAVVPFPFFMAVARGLAVRIHEGSRAAQNSLAEVSAKVDESLSGQLVIKSLTLEEFDFDRFREHCREYRRLNLNVTRNRAILIPMMMGLTSLTTIIVLAVGGPQVARGELSLGALVTLILYLQMLAGPTRTLGFIISALRRGAAALGRIQEILESEVTLVDPEPGAGVPLPVAAERRGHVRIENLSIVYPPVHEQLRLRDGGPGRAATAPLTAPGGAGGQPGGRRVLDRVSFEVPAGSTLGIVGHTGSGKTTLVRAIARQLEIEPGRVFIDGVDVTRMGLADVRRAIGFVPQDGFLFSAALADNVALGRPEASGEAIAAAVAAAELDKDLPQLPDGLDTMVGERGVNLSGGQRQRAALARVLLLDPRILILDDTLSAVDTQTADAILTRLRPFARDRTTLIVAHRLSTVQHADSIIVLDEGRVVEQGTHEELVELGGRYAALYARQQRCEASAAELELAFDEYDPDVDPERRPFSATARRPAGRGVGPEAGSDLDRGAGVEPGLERDPAVGGGGEL